MKAAEDEDLVNIIRLIRSENVGTKIFWHLISLYQNAKNALEHIEELALHGEKLKPIKIFSKAQAEDEIALCQLKNIKIVSYLDSNFPYLLKNIDDCPPLLFALGNLSLLNGKTVAVVGSAQCFS